MPVARTLSRVMASLLAPQQNACHLCGALLGEGEAFLCPSCRQALFCFRKSDIEAVEANCPPLSLALSAYCYEGEARTLVERLKFGSDLSAAYPLADGLCALYIEQLHRLPSPDGVAAVPAHPSHFRARGYNQAEALARAFCAQTRLPYLPEALVRLHHSTSQVSRSREERLQAMEGAFQARRSFSGMNLLLIDDVFTTGATAIACGDALMRAGAKRVDLLVCCRA